MAAALILGGCAELGLAPPAADFEFELSGRIAVRMQDESSSGNLAWRHSADSDELLITSPLGQGVARLMRQGATFVLTSADGREYRAADAEALTAQVLGFRLPVGGLADWVRARPAPGAFESRRDAEDRLVELAQSGWRIEYLEYRDARPSRLRLLYPGIELRLAIAEWK